VTSAFATPSRPLWLSLLAVVVAGWLMSLGFPDVGWWPFTLIGLGMVFTTARGLTLGRSLLVGAVAGFTYYGVLITWLTVYLGIVPWLALTLAQTVLFAFGFVVLTLTWRVIDARRGSVGWNLGVAPVLLASAWLVREAIASVWPWGGFAWGRLAHSQASGPALEWFSWIGTSGVSYLLAWVVAVVVVSLSERRVSRLSAATLAVSLAVFVSVWPGYPSAVSGQLRVAGVQGNTDAALFASNVRGQNLMDHWDVTTQLYGEDIDVLIWPENASDLDPLRHPDAAAILDSVVVNTGAPLIVGTITREGDQTFNSVLQWEVPSNPGVGFAADQYDKIHPVPFAEYLPARDFFYPLAPDMFDLVPRDYSFGTRDTVMDVAGHRAGIAICYDIVDDQIFWQMMDEGADIIFAPTNNADFGVTDQSVQQLDIARIRAVETGRTVVNVSTVGVSAVITPDGEYLDRLEPFTADYMLETVPTTSHTTPATRLGRSLELSLIALGFAGLVLTAWAKPGVLSRRARDHFDQ
jgi:apolipoprotein N-acyltransferase